jgi:transposase
MSGRKVKAAARRKAIKEALKKRKADRKAASPEEIARYEKRKSVVEAVHGGIPVSLVSRTHNVPQRSVFRWLALYDQGGWAGLRDKWRSGRPSKISPEVMKWLYEAITGGNPRQYQFKFALWSLAIVPIFRDHQPL